MVNKIFSLIVGLHRRCFSVDRRRRRKLLETFNSKSTLLDDVSCNKYLHIEISERRRLITWLTCSCMRSRSIADVTSRRANRDRCVVIWAGRWSPCICIFETHSVELGVCPMQLFIFDLVTFIHFKICCCVQKFMKIGWFFTEIWRYI